MSIRLNRIGKRRVIAGVTITLGAIACSSYPSSHDVTSVQTAAMPLTTRSCQGLDVAVTKAAVSKPSAEGQGGTTYAIDVHGDVWGWGANRPPHFPLGHASTDSSGALGAQVPNPVRIGVSGATRLAAGRDGACALLDDGTVTCWGRELGGPATPLPGTHTYLPHPVHDDIDVLGDVTAITYGDNHACAIKSDTSVWCWGDDKLGQLGDGVAVGDGNVGGATLTAVPMLNMAAVTQIVAAGSSTCLRRTLPSLVGEIDCLGDNSAGQLGQGTAGNSPPVPEPIPTPITLPAGSHLNFASLFGGGHGTFCATTVKVSGAQKTFCWGFNQQGEAAITNTLGTPGIIPISDDVDARWAHGYLNGCEIKSPGAVSCWGSSQYGVLPGIAPGQVVLANTPVPGVASAFRMSVGETHACALTGDSLSCWGQNVDGEIGNGTTGDTAGVTRLHLSVPPPACPAQQGQAGAPCGTISNTCGETTECGCSPLNTCDTATHTCKDNPTACPQGCGAGTFCSNHVCKTFCGTLPLTDPSVGVSVALMEQGAHVDSPATYGANGCGAFIVDIANATQRSNQEVTAGPQLPQNVTQADCPNTRITVAFYANGDLLQTVGPVAGQWTFSSAANLFYCAWGNLSSIGIYTPAPNVTSGDLRVTVLAERLSGGTSQKLPVEVSVFSQCNDGQLDGSETDIDCGGPFCPACGAGCRGNTHDCGDGKGCVSTQCP